MNDSGSEGQPCLALPKRLREGKAVRLLPIPRRDLTVGPVRDLLCPTKRSEVGTGQPETCSETGFDILDRKVGKKRGDFLFVARFLPGFGGFMAYKFSLGQRSVVVNTVLFSTETPAAFVLTLYKLDRFKINIFPSR